MRSRPYRYQTSSYLSSISISVTINIKIFISFPAGFEDEVKGMWGWMLDGYIGIK